MCKAHIINETTDFKKAITSKLCPSDKLRLHHCFKFV